ncbi:cytochrome-c peroxidase [Helicobacter saguini]|uniref:C-type cytochrome n=1 Tax=Helicobacter saguini TaxID=1548018 RepID=A0A6L7D5Q6_9HELI|nr:cytochrome c peroxidase [Helicobacter saguini]MWV62143.1 c-type cytochrome [Helicobacter saguini]MWV69537.1 c-type cytochrome [Helicobacter saguini]MWV70912.1 c-type cytochrome [Helicobacter saguini]
MQPNNIFSKITFIASLFLCSYILLFHFVFSFEDIGAKLQEILNEAKKATLEPLPESNKLLTLQKSMFVKTPINMSKEQIELGKILYFDSRLSGNKLLSCNSCHNIALYGSSFVDIGKEKLNAPTLFNSLFNDAAHYKGDISRFDKEDSVIPAKNVVARASLHALSAENEMNADTKKIVSMITESSEYMSYFKRAYGVKVKVNAELIALSLSSFILTLNTFSRYDDFLAGNLKAMSVEEADGMRVFINRGCVACHNGVGLGGTMQPFEVMKNYKYSSIGGMTSNIDKMLKVPTLRNITLTAPYFHNGAIHKLEDAIQEMGNIQLGINLSNKEAKQIMIFFETLRGQVEITIPQLPKL